jgi:hypothetical protein
MWPRGRSRSILIEPPRKNGSKQLPHRRCDALQALPVHAARTRHNSCSSASTGSLDRSDSAHHQPTDSGSQKAMLKLNKDHHQAPRPSEGILQGRKESTKSVTLTSGCIANSTAGLSTGAEHSVVRAQLQMVAEDVRAHKQPSQRSSTG